MINEPGDPLVYPTNIRLPASGDPRNSTVTGAAGHDLADRTAYLKAAVEAVEFTIDTWVDDLTVFTVTTASTGTYTVPATAIEVDVTLIGGGQSGYTGGVGVGGNGGKSGEYVRFPLHVTPGQVLAYVVGAGGSSSGQAGGHTLLLNNADAATIAFAMGGDSNGTGLGSDVQIAAGMPNDVAGGAGGTGLIGSRGHSRNGCAGGAPGTTGNPGQGGKGYGAGGGGGRQSSSTASGGGGGAGGYLRHDIGGSAGAAAIGGAGRAGYLRIAVTRTGQP